jgi:hypothetical protein
MTGSGGLGAVSVGISEALIGLLVLGVVAVVIWKLVKLLLAALK